ncbi:MAG: inorganic phosphate transporter, partial [Gammaproteobacteria bacterium]|nr:inorganic phosphate transporter [Gammaproteobacteria bacterium]
WGWAPVITPPLTRGGGGAGAGAAPTAAGTLNGLPEWLDFLQIHNLPGETLPIPVWIIVLCALVMAAGTAAGGWRIIKTMGHNVVRLHPINGFMAETSGAVVIFLASVMGIPVSTTHVISSSIMGVGAAKRFNAVRWTVVERMVWAWVFTLPITAVISWLIAKGLLAL